MSASFLPPRLPVDHERERRWTVDSTRRRRHQEPFAVGGDVPEQSARGNPEESFRYSRLKDGIRDFSVGHDLLEFSSPFRQETSSRHSVIIRSAHSTSETKTAGLPNFAPQLLRSVSVTPRAREQAPQENTAIFLATIFSRVSLNGGHPTGMMARFGCGHKTRESSFAASKTRASSGLGHGASDHAINDEQDNGAND